MNTPIVAEPTSRGVTKTALVIAPLLSPEFL
jgi:hypothetical protein